MDREDRALHDLKVAEFLELVGIGALIAQGAKIVRRLTSQAKTLKSVIENQELIMSSIAETNAKLDELVKDVKRVLDLVSNAPLPAATQGEVDALAARLDSLDADVEGVSPEPTPAPEPPAV